MLTIAEDGRSPPPSQIPFEEICLSKPEQNKMGLFTSTNYKAYVRFGTSSHQMNQAKCLIDTSAARNLVSKSFLHPTWTSRIMRRSFRKLRSANKQEIRSEEEILSYLKIGDLRILVLFGVGDNLAVDSLIRMSFIDKYIQESFAAERKLVAWHSEPLNIIRPGTKAANAATDANHIDSQFSSTPLADDIFLKVVVAKAVRLAPHAPTTVLVKSIGSGRRVIKPIDDSAAGVPLDVAKEIADAISNKPFHILLKNVSTKPVQLPKRMNVMNIADSGADTIAVEDALLETDSETISAV